MPCRIPPVAGRNFVWVGGGLWIMDYGLWTMDYGGVAPYTPSNFLPTAGESYQREPPPDFVPTEKRRLPAKSPQLALRSATGLLRDYRLRLGIVQDWLRFGH